MLKWYLKGDRNIRYVFSQASSKRPNLSLGANSRLRNSSPGSGLIQQLFPRLRGLHIASGNNNINNNNNSASSPMKTLTIPSKSDSNVNSSLTALSPNRKWGRARPSLKLPNDRDFKLLIEKLPKTPLWYVKTLALAHRLLVIPEHKLRKTGPRKEFKILTDLSTRFDQLHELLDSKNPIRDKEMMQEIKQRRKSIEQEWAQFWYLQQYPLVAEDSLSVELYKINGKLIMPPALELPVKILSKALALDLKMYQYVKDLSASKDAVCLKSCALDDLYPLPLNMFEKMWKRFYYTPLSIDCILPIVFSIGEQFSSNIASKVLIQLSRESSLPIAKSGMPLKKHKKLYYMAINKALNDRLLRYFSDSLLRDGSSKICNDWKSALHLLENITVNRHVKINPYIAKDMTSSIPRYAYMAFFNALVRLNSNLDNPAFNKLVRSQRNGSERELQNLVMVSKKIGSDLVFFHLNHYLRLVYELIRRGMLDQSTWFITHIINSRTWRNTPYVETEKEARDRLNMMLYHAMHVGVDFVTLKTTQGINPKNKVEQLLDILELQGVKPDVKTYSIIFSNYKKRGMDKEALEVIQEIVNLDNNEHLFHGNSASVLATDLLDLVSYHYAPTTVMDYYIQMFGTEYITKLGIAGLVYNGVIGSGEGAIADRLENESTLPPVPSKLKNLRSNIMTLTILFQSVLAKTESRDSVYALWKHLVAVVKREQKYDSFTGQFQNFQKPAFAKDRDIFNRKITNEESQLIKMPRFQDHPTAGNLLVHNFDFGIITAFIKCLCRLGERDLALGELEDILHTIKFNNMSSHPFTALIKAFSNDINKCVQVLELAAKYDIPPDSSMLGGIINACERSGKSEEAAKWTILANDLGVNLNMGSSIGLSNSDSGQMPVSVVGQLARKKNSVGQSSNNNNDVEISW